MSRGVLRDGQRITVIIPTVGRSGLLEDTLRSLHESGARVGEVIVVDGDAESSSLAVVEHAVAAYPRLNVRHLRSARGLCRQRNLAVDEAAGQLIVFLDDDVWVEALGIERLTAAFADPEVLGATGHTVEPSPRRVSLKHSRLRRLLPGGRHQGRMTPSGYPNRLRDVHRDHDVEFMNGCWMAVRTDLARRLGFDEALEETGGYALAEDEDFGYRVSRLGRVRFVAAARLEHRNMGFASADQRAFNRAMVLNRAYLFRKSFVPTRLARAHFALMLAVFLVHRLLNADWRGVRGLVEGLGEIRTDARGRR